MSFQIHVTMCGTVPVRMFVTLIGLLTSVFIKKGSGEIILSGKNNETEK